MATKAKTEPAPKSPQFPAPGAPSPLAAAFGKAVKLVDSGKYEEAEKALETLVRDAQQTGEWPIKRRAEVYLGLARAKAHPAKAMAADAATEIQACLNRRDPEQALKLCEKALKGHPAQGAIHYLRAVAHAQSDNVEAAAESLKKAVELEPNFVFQWHMEPDFNAIRKSPLFAFTEGR